MCEINNYDIDNYDINNELNIFFTGQHYCPWWHVWMVPNRRASASRTLPFSDRGSRSGCRYTCCMMFKIDLIKLNLIAKKIFEFYLFNG